MRNPEIILSNLSKHSGQLDYKYERLYRLLFNEEMYFVAYQNLAPKQGNMAHGTDGKTIDQMNLARIENLIDSLRDESYQPKPARRKYIPKKNGKKRPLGIPSFEDKLLQEVVRMILEAIYEGHFEQTSHGFRPMRSCHTALTSIQVTFTGAKWFVEGDIKGFFDNIDHSVLMKILSERIADERFLRLIRKFLTAGYIEDWEFKNTYSGTPQGGIISPILANIYLDKFDKYMNEYAQTFDKGKKRKTSKQSRKLENKVRRLRIALKSVKDENRKAEIESEIKELQKQQLSIPYADAMDVSFRRIKYVRYADDFLIGVIGTKAECEKIKADITEFMRDKLNLELSAEKTLITNSQEYAHFLGYEIYARTSNALRRNSNGQLKRAFNGTIILRLSPEKVRNKLLDLKGLKIKQVSGKEKWEPVGRGNLIYMEPQEIIAKYNAEIRGFYNYFSIAHNISGVGNTFGYVMKYSCLKTIARKQNTSIRKIFAKYRQGNNIVVEYTDKKGRKKHTILYNEGFSRKSPTKTAEIDAVKGNFKSTVPSTTLAERLMDRRCELCDAEGAVTMHHVKRMSDLRPSRPWELIMLQMHRKTIALCDNCFKLVKQDER